MRTTAHTDYIDNAYTNGIAVRTTAHARDVRDKMLLADKYPDPPRIRMRININRETSTRYTTTDRSKHRNFHWGPPL